MSYNTARPYAASYVLLEKDGKMAFLLRSGTDWMNGYYGLPPGKVENDEASTAGAIREAKEEVGVNIEPTDIEAVLTMHRREPGDHAPYWVDMFFRAKKWTGKAYNAEPQVHGELVWLDPSDLPENVVPSVKFAFEQIQKGNIYCEYGWDN